VALLLPALSCLPRSFRLAPGIQLLFLAQLLGVTCLANSRVSLVLYGLLLRQTLCDARVVLRLARAGFSATSQRPQHGLRLAIDDA